MYAAAKPGCHGNAEDIFNQQPDKTVKPSEHISSYLVLIQDKGSDLILIDSNGNHPHRKTAVSIIFINHIKI
jgi:hypothetical protein